MTLLLNRNISGGRVMISEAIQRTRGAAFVVKEVVQREALQIDKWMFGLMISVLCFFASRDINRISTSVEELNKTQTAQLTYYHQIELRVRETEVHNQELRAEVQKITQMLEASRYGSRKSNP
jgi:hypothetical protein